MESKQTHIKVLTCLRDHLSCHSLSRFWGIQNVVTISIVMCAADVKLFISICVGIVKTIVVVVSLISDEFEDR
jgi:hypothetical protein